MNEYAIECTLSATTIIFLCGKVRKKLHIGEVSVSLKDNKIDIIVKREAGAFP